MSLRLEGITKRFAGVVANEGVSLDVRDGEIHALLGENGAGKTTLMNIVFGLVRPDAGRMEVDGEAVAVSGPRDAFELGIGMVHQHFMLVPDMTVAENVALSNGSGRVGRLHLREIEGRLSDFSQRFGLAVRPDAPVEELSVGEQQRVEIMKLLYRGARLLILDEPTGVLTPGEWSHLAEVLRSLAAQGKSIVFITHKLDEVFAVGDRCTVLRDGRVVGTRRPAKATKQELARLMVGREVTLRVVRERLEPGDPVLHVRGLHLYDGSREVLRDIELSVREREVVGIAGVDGNGQRELVETIMGVRKPDAGEIALVGERVERRSPATFLAAGGATIPEDRRGSGVALSLSLADNLAMKDFARAPLSRRGLLDLRAVRAHGERLRRAFDIRAPGLEAQMAQLSGGNQQKAVLARELDRRPRLLIAAQPTRGLDVGAMEFVYERLAEYKRSGGAILLISTELNEVLSLSDRIAVMVRGGFPRVLDAEEANADLLGILMAGEESP